MPFPPDPHRLRVNLADAGAYLEQLWRVHNNAQEADLSKDIAYWEKLLDERARMLVAALDDQKR